MATAHRTNEKYLAAEAEGRLISSVVAVVVCTLCQYDVSWASAFIATTMSIDLIRANLRKHILENNVILHHLITIILAVSFVNNPNLYNSPSIVQGTKGLLMMEITNPFVHASWALAKLPSWRRAATPYHTLKLMVAVLGSLGLWPYYRIWASYKFASIVTFENAFTWTYGYIYVTFGIFEDVANGPQCSSSSYTKLGMTFEQTVEESQNSSAVDSKDDAPETVEKEATSSSTLLQSNVNRFVLFPLKYKDIWNFYKKAEASFWTAEELDLLADSKDWLLLNPGERHFIEQTLAFFAASDGIVNENLALNFLSEVQIPEARCFYGFQIAMENVHSEVYSQLIDTYVKDNKRKHELFQGIQTFPSIQKKADWALHWTSRNVASFGERLVAFACVEGISFSSAFASIFYLKKRGLMVHGLGKSNELIARDEGLHRDFACLLFKYLSDSERPSQERVHQIVQECVDAECYFVEEALPVGLIGMNAKSMQTYVRYVADNLLMQLGLPKLYNIPSCPFEWMEAISIQSKTNFFESRVTEYAMANVGTTEESRQFSLTEDFYKIIL